MSYAAVKITETGLLLLETSEAASANEYTTVTGIEIGSAISVIESTFSAAEDRHLHRYEHDHRHQEEISGM